MHTFKKTEEIISDDDFIPQQRAMKQSDDYSSSEDEYHTQNKAAKVGIMEMLLITMTTNLLKYSNTATQAHITVVF